MTIYLYDTDSYWPFTLELYELLARCTRHRPQLIMGHHSDEWVYLRIMHLEEAVLRPPHDFFDFAP